MHTLFNRSRWILGLMLVMISQQGFAETFGGGMFGGAQYVAVPALPPGTRGAAWGLGGRLYMPVAAFLRIGGMGETRRFSFADGEGHGSYLAASHGGITVEWYRRIGGVTYAAGMLLGGGGTTLLHVYQRGASDSVMAVYASSGTLVAVPMITGQYALSPTITGMVMVDWMWGTRLFGARSLGGPGVKLGVLFTK